MEKCGNCGKEFDNCKTDGLTAFNIQKGQEMHFCSRDCMNAWISGKKIGMGIALILGAVLTVGLFQEFGMSSFFYFFIPYTIRQLKDGIIEISSSGLAGEVISFMAVLLGGITIIYPLVKLIQEIKEYRRIEKLLAEQ